MTNEAAERLRALMLALARDEPVYESDAEVEGLFDAALAAERAAGIDEERDALLERFDPNGSYDGWDVRLEITAHYARLAPTEGAA